MVADYLGPRGWEARRLRLVQEFDQIEQSVCDLLTILDLVACTALSGNVLIF
jgi:hypothetical protein